MEWLLEYKPQCVFFVPIDRHPGRFSLFILAITSSDMSVPPRSMAVFGAMVYPQVGKNFNPEADDFNLEGVFSLGLHNLTEFIGELSSNANKELGIEQVLVTAASIQLFFHRLKI